MIAVGMVQLTVHQVINMIAMGHSLMSAAGAVLVLMIVSAVTGYWLAAIRIHSRNSNLVFLDLTIFLMTKMAILQVVDMSIVLNGDMSAVRAMLVGMRHDKSSWKLEGTTRLARQGTQSRGWSDRILP